MIVHIVTQSRLYPELELDLTFEPAVEMVVTGMAEGVLKLVSPAKRETLMQRAKDLLNNEESPITNKTI